MENIEHDKILNLSSKYTKYFPDLSKLYELDNFINFITYIYDYN